MKLKKVYPKGYLSELVGSFETEKIKKIVFWLKEGGGKIKGGKKLIIKSTEIMKSALAFSDFLYMNENFKNIQKLLADINMKIDAQNLSKLTAGFQLLVDAKSISDIDKREYQINSARSLLYEGNEIYKKIFNEISTKDKSIDGNFKSVSYNTLRLIIITELGIIRSYFVQKEFEICKIRLLLLKQFIIKATIHYCEVVTKDDIPWWAYLLALTIGLPFLPFTIFSKKDIEEMKKEDLSKIINNLTDRTNVLTDQYQEILTKTRELELSTPEQINALDNMICFVDGYISEVNSLDATDDKSLLKNIISVENF